MHQAAVEQRGSADFGTSQFVYMTQKFCVSKDAEKLWRGDFVRQTYFDFGTQLCDLE